MSESKTETMQLRYGINPNQRGWIAFPEGLLKFLNGSPGEINMLDALNAWQLVRELRKALGLPAAASFKHVSPASAAVAVPLSRALRQSYFIGDIRLTPLLCAYARARGGDRLSSMGDFVALSDNCDASTARYIAKEVSDGIIAPGYSRRALKILKQKKGGKYLIIKVDRNYEPPVTESRQVFGVTIAHDHNKVVLDESVLAPEYIVTQRKDLSPEAKRDLIVAMITLKYTQSNSVAFAYDGQTIGVGAGQQSRIHCTRIAADKARRWMLRQHPKVLGLRFREGLTRARINNAIDRFLDDWTITPGDLKEALASDYNMEYPCLSTQESLEWLRRFNETAFASDAFFPFGDCLACAQGIGTKYVVQPGGSEHDEEVIATADRLGMVMACNGIRLFHH